MPTLLTCPQGHQWEVADAGLETRDGSYLCPTCGQAVDAAASPPLAVTEMLSPGTGVVPDLAPTNAAATCSESVVGQVPAELAEHTRYRILGLIGRGGMGAVYKAEHRLMERLVALKVLGRRLLDDPAAVARFHREVKAAARLSHPNIVQAYDADQAGPLHFLVMEYVEGTDLAQLVAQQGPLPVAQACDYIRQAALGLQHAFEHGMVHRDIKPHNLMRTADGQIKILDFGLALFVSESAPLGGLVQTEQAEQLADLPAGGATDITQAGTLMGTADYIAPEQTWDAHNSDIRADLYSLGCTLYFLLAGHSPFPTGAFADKVLAQRNRQPRPLTELRKDVPPPLLRVLEQMLAKDSTQRFQTPVEVAHALEPFTRKPRRRWGLLAVGALVCAVLGLAVYRHGPTTVRFVATKGQLLLQSADADARVRIIRDGAPDQLLDLERGRPVELPAGAYQIELADGPKGLYVSPGEFTVPRGGQAAVSLLPDTVRRFQGHTSAAWSVAFSADGRQALSSGTDRTLRLWDVATGKELRCFKGHLSTVYDVAFSPDGRLALSCGNEPDVSPRVWDVETARELRRFEGHTASVRKVTFSPDGQQVLSAGWDNTVRLWDVNSGQEVRKLPAHRDWVEAVVFFPDGKRAVSSCKDGTLRLWDLTTGQFRELQGHQGPAMRVAVSPDGRRFLSSGDDRVLRLWDAESGQLLHSFEGHTGRIECVAFSPDGLLALSGGADGTLRLWDVQRGQELYRFECDAGTVYGVAFSPEGRQALAGFSGGMLRLLQLPDPGRLARLAARVPVVEFRAAVRVFRGHTGSVRSAVLSPNGRLALSCSGIPRGDRTIRLWDLDRGVELRKFSGHTDQVYRVTFSPDGRQALSGSVDRTMRLWDVATGQELRCFKGHTDVVNSVAFAPGGGLVLSAGFDRTIRLWDPETGKEMHRLTGHTDQIIEATFSPDGQRILSASFDKTVRLWDVATRKEMHRLTGHTAKAECVAFSADGRRALSGGHDMTIRLWDLESGQELASFTRHLNVVTSVAFSRDGRRVLSASHDQTIRLWELESGRELCRFEGHTTSVWSAVFSADERQVLSASFGGTLRLWDAPP